MDVQLFLDSLTNDPDYKDQIAHIHTQPAREAQLADLPEGLHPGCDAFLKTLNVPHLYQHQAEAVDAPGCYPEVSEFESHLLSHSSCLLPVLNLRV